jgi:hypothetical protein
VPSTFSPAMKLSSLLSHLEFPFNDDIEFQGSDKSHTSHMIQPWKLCGHSFQLARHWKLLRHPRRLIRWARAGAKL